ncbi:tRNA pseudouridine(55) synthase TruB [Enterococcus saccharolyticus]|uniref:tRNA pseudouridine synthase B n=1 Tax=Candidatus Enterococcus willemsii TaxID=1857215 RepID=A0ABQ6YYW8_9ENTE|nr:MULTISPECIES: tRNA pseudouridine(55) synthase TruB [Enterococcus]KAF1302875.1 tRNA pseudouridine(55) synthase TruB [Enterococcus sp. CU12B]MCD5000976.1 tRNA pseudouridine(55) synthase TruB [Enterococcus saccharolyticus]
MNGILPLWKERGMTSHDCVFKLRKILHTKKVGHGGTLDPDVDGVLPICIGKGTKVIEFLTDSGKVYEGEITLGYSTTTEDASGEIVEQQVLASPFSKEEIDRAMHELIGEIIQIPPMYSAVKVNGKRLYEYARNGETVERPERKAQIDSFERTSEPVWHPDGTQSWRFRVVCGKGTYVRTLAVDTGKKLGVPAHMSDLTRTASAGFAKEQAVTLAQVQEAMDSEKLGDILLPIEFGVKDFFRVDISEDLWKKVKNGMRLRFEDFELTAMPTEPFAVFYQEKVVCLYQPHEKQPGIVKPLKVLQTE